MLLSMHCVDSVFNQREEAGKVKKIALKDIIILTERN